MKPASAASSGVAVLCLCAGTLALVGCSRTVKPSAEPAQSKSAAFDAAQPPGTPEPRPAAERPDAREKRPAAEAKPREPSSRVLWEVQTAGGSDRFVQLVPAKDKLLGVRGGVLYAFDAPSGKPVWRFPETGAVARVRKLTQCPFVLGVFGDMVVTRMPEKFHAGLLALDTSDGTVKRRLDLKADLHFPDPGFGRMIWIYRTLVDSQIAFAAEGRGKKATQICVVDLLGWCEIARFEMPRLARYLDVRQGRVFGYLQRTDETFYRAFTADLKLAELWSLPIHDGSGYPRYVFLPDGSRLLPDGRLSAECAYGGNRPWGPYSSVHAAGDSVFVLDRYGFARVDPRGGRELWRLDLGPSATISDAKTAAAENVVAMANGNYLYVIDAGSGSLRAAIRVLPGFKSMMERSLYMFRNAVRVACDGPRVYFASSTGLTACSTHPVDPDAPDPYDPGDPAYSIARCRRAASEGDWEAALKAIQEVSASLGLRPGARGELAELLSQLSRSPAVAAYPGLWTYVALSDGWVCGELFLEEYKDLFARVQGVRRYRVAASLFAMGTEDALRAVVGLLHASYPGHCMPYAARAKEMLTGVRPIEEMLSIKNMSDVEFALDPPMDKDTFERLLPKLRERSRSWVDRFARHIPPERRLMLLEGKTDDKAFGRLAEIARHQVESRARGKGETGKIDMVTRDGAGDGPPQEGF